VTADMHMGHQKVAEAFSSHRFSIRRGKRRYVGGLLVRRLRVRQRPAQQDHVLRGSNSRLSRATETHARGHR
jgi:hypothetical protein